LRALETKGIDTLCWLTCHDGCEGYLYMA
jgi:hypothetical protein